MMEKTEVQKLLREGVVKVTFTKVNGEKREMPCTLNTSLMKNLSENYDEATTRANEDVQRVWCVDMEAWRSFRWDSLVSAEVV